MALLNGFVTLALVIGLGALLAHLRVVTEVTQRELSRLAFWVASPALILTTMARTDLDAALVGGTVAALASVVVAGGAYAAYARWWLRRDLDGLLVGVLCSTYVNAGNLGLAIAGYVLGNAAAVVPALLVQLLLLQPLSLAVLESRTRGRTGLLQVAGQPLRTPLTLASVAGLVLAATGWRLPTAVQAPVELVGAMAIPMMLLAYGIALRLGPGLAEAGARAELGVIVACKLAVQPLTAYVVAVLLGIEGPALVAVVVTAALPTAQNIFIIASRYRRAETLARDSVLLTTLASVPVIVGVVLVLG
ncbi:AEC family transporter [Nocardioides aurantiacus]|uniref:AEC family transporter n=1 Tax=Nocardioides aurantiacus TaxID=86796 RepID=A0A3N2D041_9ACTN|nr:AEC family transporter [Nocardioides aurantiacus]ROR93018.1 hypothetical protein EDD33_3923 [Nocardioides aurantiacus]